MSAPTIQPSDPAGGASLAPDAGFAGENSTINPTEARVQQHDQPQPEKGTAQNHVLRIWRGISCRTTGSGLSQTGDA